MYINLGVAKNVGELIELIKEYDIPNNAQLSAAGEDCYVIVNTDKNAEIDGIVFDGNDYWIEEVNENEEE